MPWCCSSSRACCARRCSRSSGSTGCGSGARSPSERALLAGLAVALPALWLVPEWLGSGDPLAAGAQARSEPSWSLSLRTTRGSPRFAACTTSPACRSSSEHWRPSRWPHCGATGWEATTPPQRPIAPRWRWGRSPCSGWRWWWRWCRPASRAARATSCRRWCWAACWPGSAPPGSSQALPGTRAAVAGAVGLAALAYPLADDASTGSSARAVTPTGWPPCRRTWRGRARRRWPGGAGRRRRAGCQPQPVRHAPGVGEQAADRIGRGGGGADVRHERAHVGPSR